MRKARPAALGLALLIVLATIAVYVPVAHFPFVNWDDGEYVTGNDQVLSGISLETARWAFTSRVAGNWHPVTMLSHAMDVTIAGADAGWHHVTNLLLHVVNTLLVLVLFATTTRRLGASAFVAAIFGLHPLHVESVAWISERKDVLSTAFALLAMLTYVGWVRRPNWRRYVTFSTLFALALMSKPMVVTLPVVLLLLDVWPLRRTTWTEATGVHWRRLFIEKAPLVAAAIVVGVLTLLVQGGAVASAAALSPLVRLSNALTGYIEYVQLALWPAGLSAFYPMRPVPWPSAAGAAALLLVISLAVVRHGRSRPWLPVGWGWFVITLAPVIGILQTGEQAMADRYMYVPLIGLSIIVAWGAGELAAAWPPIGRAVRPVAVIVIAGLALLTRAQVMTWSGSEALWRHAIRVSSPNYRAEDKLAETLRDEGRLGEAAFHYERALAQAPASSPIYEAIIHNSLGLVRVAEGDGARALSEFERAVLLHPQFSEARSNLGAALATAGRPAEALEHYGIAAQLSPLAADVRLGYGAALQAAGRPAEAQAQFVEALRLDPALAPARANLAALLARQGRVREAVAEFSRALEDDPAHPTWHYGLGVLLADLGQTADARRHLEMALRLAPDLEPARRALDAIRDVP